MDLKAYLLGEIAEQDRRLVAEHVAACRECGEELERLCLTEAALLTLRGEEMPRRIAFVSDKVFEPRWWQALWSSGPRLGFVSAAMLALAIVGHALLRPVAPPAPAPVDTAQVEALVEARVAERLQVAVEKAVAESEARHARKTVELVAAVERRMEMERKADMLAVQESFEVLRKRTNVMLAASADLGGRR